MGCHPSDKFVNGEALLIVYQVTQQEKYFTAATQLFRMMQATYFDDKENFIEVGSMIEPGKTVCMIEAMKLFNEIESDVKGKIVKVLVEDASPVEYDQPLFLVDPS